MSSMYAQNKQRGCGMIRVKELENEIRKIQAEIEIIQENCVHIIKPFVLKSGEKLSHERCPKCDKYFEGWWCPKSADTFCDYNQEDGSYDEDSCRYCGHPEERK